MVGEEPPHLVTSAEVTIGIALPLKPQLVDHGPLADLDSSDWDGDGANVIL
jgi:hypothetical protein